MNMIILDEYLEAALLRSKGYKLAEVKVAPESRRVKFHFSDHDGRAQELINGHRAGRVTVGSLEFCEALTWAKNQIFSTKAGAGDSRSERYRAQTGEILINGNHR